MGMHADYLSGVLALAVVLCSCKGKVNPSGPELSAASQQAAQLRSEAVKYAMGSDCDGAIKFYQKLLELEDGALASADDYNNLGVCLQEVGLLEQAEMIYQKGIQRHYHSEKLHKNLGMLLEDLSATEWSTGHNSENTDARSSLATRHLTFATRLQLASLWESRSAEIPKQNRIGVGRKTVAIYGRQRNEEGLGEGAWGPGTIDEDGRLLEHDEDVLVMMARHLVKLGFNVEVYINLPAGQSGMDKHGVMWRPFYALHGMLPPVWNETHVLWPKYPVDKQPDVYISWRNLEAAHLFNSSVYQAKNLTPPVSYLWLTNLINKPHILTPKFTGPLHGIITNSYFQAAIMPRRIQSCLLISRVAVEQEPPYSIRQVENSNFRFLYAGHPLAGLDIALEAWPDIRRQIAAKVPGGESAKLQVIFAPDDQLDLQYQEHKWYQNLKTRIYHLLEQDGVEYRPKLSLRKIARAFVSAGFYLHPAWRPEASSVHLVKAQIHGAIPITSRNPYSSLNETCGEFDMGPTPQEGHSSEDSQYVQRWVGSVVAAATMPRESLQLRRESMIAQSRQRFHFKYIADEWAVLFRRHIALGANATCGNSTEQVVQQRDPSEKPTSANKEEL